MRKLIKCNRDKMIQIFNINKMNKDKNQKYYIYKKKMIFL